MNALVQGTRERLRSWLWNEHQLTYTKYSKLPTELKLKIQAQYQGRRQRVVELLKEGDYDTGVDI